MADFQTCYAFVLPDEDYTPPRYALSPDPTKAAPNAQAISGINSASFPAVFAVIASLPQAHRAAPVLAFYQSTYFGPWLAQLPNEIAMRVMDAEVNEGQGIGVRLLQTAANCCNGAQDHIAVDGLWGPDTVAAACEPATADLVGAFKAARAARYKAIAAADPAEAPNLAGWLVRAEK